MPKYAVINLTGTLPDDILPSNIEQGEDKDMVFIYFRNDGNLYLYDAVKNHEFNLFELDT